MTACPIHLQRPAGERIRARWTGWLLLASLIAAVPAEVAWAGSPFATGANATQQQLVAILTPLAAVAVMVSGAMAWFGRLSWWWMVAVVIGTVLVFGGPQIVSWIRGLFGV
ncbi:MULTISPECIES: TrbC/VirB2 family protein [Variovorax]|uniref:TrbC/VirB2 family protein n=1 Tax=Variovorax TaxID=34072 RepID=UPI0024809770|nr:MULTISPECIES: TrbC/VirB2 family protein [Variovorax]MDR6890821.1 type IV secretion system protein VirB2 [Variovorax sp. 3319]WGT63702.1 TrbC/VirB2 family protein [Variovorax paradoxus]